MILYGSEDVALQLDCSREYIQRLAKEHGIGQKKGGVWLFTKREVTRLHKRVRPRGHPPKP